MSKAGHYLKELSRTGVNKRLLGEEYRQHHPDGYSYSQFCFHLNQQDVTSQPSMVLDHQPAEKLFMDFASHYQTTGVPARAGKPREKALVENQVKLIYSKSLCPVRQHAGL